MAIAIRPLFMYPQCFFLRDKIIYDLTRLYIDFNS